MPFQDDAEFCEIRPECLGRGPSVRGGKGEVLSGAGSGVNDPTKVVPCNRRLLQGYFPIDIVQILVYACRSDMVFPDHEQGLDKMFSIPPHQLRWVNDNNTAQLERPGKFVLCGMDIGR